MPLPPTDLNLPERIDFSEEEESRKLIGSGYKQPRHRGAPVLKKWYRAALDKRQYKPQYALSDKYKQAEKGVPPAAQNYQELVVGDTVSGLLSPLAKEMGGGAAKNWLDYIISPKEKFSDKLTEEVGAEAANSWRDSIEPEKKGKKGLFSPALTEREQREITGEYDPTGPQTPGVFGGSTEWDSRNPLRNEQGVLINQRGEPLPDGAEGWDAYGYAYYGDGFKGMIAKFRGTFEEAAYQREGIKESDDP